MTKRERVLAEPCGCGAQRGERCRPTTVLYGFHRERLERAGLGLHAPREYDRRFGRPHPEARR